MTLPIHILERLGLQQATVDGGVITDRILECSTEWAGLLASDDSRNGIIELSNSINEFAYDEYPSYLRSSSPRSVRVLRQGVPWFSVALFPADPDLCRNPPGWCESVVLVRWLLDSGYAIDSWCDQVAGKGVVWWHRKGNAANETENHIAAEIISAICENAVDKSLSPFLGATEINISSGLSSSQQAINLLANGLIETNPKWRFLSLYRSIENGYLEEILLRLNQEFYFDPKLAVSHAESALQSEVKQFFEFVKLRGLEDYFSNFSKSFDALVGQNDRFANAIANSLKPDKSSSEQPDWQRGVARSYKIRCAIAHAGRGDTFIELHEGWRQSLEKLLPLLEGAALQACSITLS